ncbi:MULTISPECIES: hypothetical protein [Sphingobacterium]|uniref:Uncharacterized protein n=1 Tax=Sphingobacterium litopenaei TaxID=2763500 RepID=A0ABR7YBY5_9SPHI|nr:MULTISPECIES: hypothetical protein [Sphingobacterium]MBD1428817.1 hypothetical protein [Sphingobacterium litopenaei]NGM72520.1 hypothetical protein [Sphingobacterium sp. SGL-16]
METNIEQLKYDKGEILSFYLTKGNIDDRNLKHMMDNEKALHNLPIHLFTQTNFYLPITADFGGMAK